MGKNTQANVTYSNEVFKQYILQLSTDLVWKNQSLANASESTDPTQRYRAELFVLANRNRLTFDVVRAFPRVILANAFGANDETIEIYASDKNKIPEDRRQDVVDLYQAALKSKNSLTGNYAYYDMLNRKYVSVYTEENNYYRMLMGFPDLDDPEPVLVKYRATEFSQEEEVPIYELPTSRRYEMEDNGELAALIAKYPRKHYLRYVGRRRIDFFNARIAERFSLLWRNNCKSDLLNDAWDTCYETCRHMIMAVYYSNAFKRTNDLYENFLAMAILFTTIQQMQKLYLEADFTRDFYDVESLKVVYDSYSVPFFSEIPIKYHRKIVKNINRLISNKGSDNVFFDLFDIFDLGSMELYNYFLVKRHNVDGMGNPIFTLLYEGEGLISDDEGRPIIDDDGYAFYEPGDRDRPELDDRGRPVLASDSFVWKFSKVKIGADPAMAVSDYANDADYDLITGLDPYWVEDQKLQETMNNTEINFIESKYIGVQIVFDLLKISYENAYLFRMITDNITKTSDITGPLYFSWPDIGIRVTIFDVFIYLAMLTCQAFGYEPLIADRIPAVAATLGYNYRELETVIGAKIEDSPYLSANADLRNEMAKMSFSSLADLSNNYDAIINIQDIIINGYTQASSIEEFEAYRDLYNTLLVSKEITDVYANPVSGGFLVDDDDIFIVDDDGGILMDEGAVFDDFRSLLNYYNPDLVQRFDLIVGEDNIIGEMNLVIAKLEDVLECIEYLPFSVGFDSSDMVKSLFKILKFFKSAKAELLDYNVTYVIRRRGINFFRMMDRIRGFSTNEEIQDAEDYYDFLEMSEDLYRLRREAVVISEVLEDGGYGPEYHIDDWIRTLDDQIRYIDEQIQEYLKEIVSPDDFIDSEDHRIMIFDTHRFSGKKRMEYLYEISEDGALTEVS